jgi:hypothetical protein
MDNFAINDKLGTACFLTAKAVPYSLRISQSLTICCFSDGSIQGNSSEEFSYSVHCIRPVLKMLRGSAGSRSLCWKSKLSFHAF